MVMFDEKLRQTLITLYYERRLSTPEIAKLFGVCQYTVQKWFKKFNLPLRSISEAVSLARSKNHRSYDPENDKELVVELNALCHTDFLWYPIKRKIRIQTTTTHIGQIKLFNDILSKNNLMPTRCVPCYCQSKFPNASTYKWQIYTHIDRSFEEALTCNKYQYMEGLKSDKSLLLLYFTRAIECDGGFMLRLSCSLERPVKKIIYGEAFLCSTDIQYIVDAGNIMEEVFEIPIKFQISKRQDESHSIIIK